ncbi:Activated Cdc42 kinase-like [Carabus blaptoides fortunei]
MDTGVPVMKGPGLYEFLVEAELQHYYNSIKSDLKVQSASQLKYVTDDDLNQLGMSRPEQRRLKKYYNKHFPQNYLSKFKRLLSVKKDDSLLHGNENLSVGIPGLQDGRNNGDRSQGPRVPSKHIISSDSITVNKELGMGEFGIVQQGVWTNDGERVQVAIKCLARERMQNNPIEFLKEAGIMHSIDHAHIVRLYGVVLDTDSLMLVTELAPLRSLLECLKEPSLRSSFPVLTLCDFTMQICDGMQYLEAKRLIHRDLAARNILVFSKNKVKISDFGLSRALGQGKDYYQTNFNVNLKLPIAWCAPESISYLRFTTASDVWAYGVTLWEMFSYGFQPWAALTGHQILEAIDEPNFQRLEQPDCCPSDHYTVMLDCWKHDPAQRPRFSELATRLADSRPEQVQARVTNSDSPYLLLHRVGDVITVLDKKNHEHLWKGALPNGKTGLFNPAHVVAYIGSNLPTGTNRPESFVRNDIKTSSRRKLNTTMISGPQGDLKHTGHVGLDGAYFGDLSFLGCSKVDYNSVPRQIVSPYKPQDDLEEPGAAVDSVLVGASDHAPVPTHRHSGRRLTASDNDLLHWQMPPPAAAHVDHEYHEISDEENLVGDGTRFEGLDLGPSLLDEIDSIFRNFNPRTDGSAASADHESANKCNELRELSSRTNTSTKQRKQVTVKPISASGQKTLDSAIALANEITARSMNDLDAEVKSTTPVSPNKRKFSFRFPSAGHHEHDAKSERRNFSDEAQSIPDLQSTLTEEAQQAYESLIDAPALDISSQMQQFTHQKQRSSQLSLTENPLRVLRSGNLPMIKPRVRNTDTLGSQKLRSAGSVENSLADRNSSCSGSLKSAQLTDDTEQDVKKPEHDMTDSEPVVAESEETKSAEDNPVPLPPRDRNKPILTSKARHTRKHPLIIPVSSIQRTLDKVSMVTPPEDCAQNPMNFVDTPSHTSTDAHKEPFYINQRLMGSDTSIETPDKDFDTESLHFEAQIDSELAALDELPSEDLDTANFANLSGEEKPRKASRQSQPDEEPTEVEEASMLRPNVDHVSCEDLLEFADAKPSSRARGSDSDEVRIMSKVLGADVSKQQCLFALEYSSWDVHKAIKLAKLQKLIRDTSGDPFIDLATCNSALETSQWDLGRAASWIVAVRQEDDITQGIQ